MKNLALSIKNLLCGNYDEVKGDKSFNITIAYVLKLLMIAGAASIELALTGL